MIRQQFITEWQGRVPWPTTQQVEQDLLLSRLILEIAESEQLADELVFRGGTCLHKLHLSAPLRYSEDLDYVRVTGGGIGPIFDALRGIGETLGFQTSTESGEHPKVRLRTEATGSGQPLRIKIEINTHERSPAMAPVRLPFTLDTQWHQGQADVLTFRPAELVATKIRALHQRKKGRDLFDLWLALTAMDLTGSEILAAFAPYRPAKFTARGAIETLNAKLADQTFRHDLDALVVAAPGDYDVDVAAQLVEEELLSRL